MAFSWKKSMRNSLLQMKIRYRHYQKDGNVNTDIGKQLKNRIERMDKKIHDSP